jgi:protein-tyrosine phosphatase
VRVKKVLFVCTANVCRSPMAEAIFNALAEERDLPFRAESAGTAALEGRSLDPNAVAALEEVGIYPEAHRARQVRETMIEESELVLVMSVQHAAALHRLCSNQSRKIHALPRYATGSCSEEGVPDPHGHTMVAYRSSVRQLYEYLERVVDRIGR